MWKSPLTCGHRQGRGYPHGPAANGWTPVDLSQLKAQWGATAQSSPTSTERIEERVDRPDVVSGTSILESTQKLVLETAAMRSSLKQSERRRVTYLMM